VLSALALFFALGGTAIAARHYLITSTSQIKPSVLKQLQGHAGTNGATGVAGPQGPTGAPGPTGTAGSPGGQGPPATALWANVTSTGTLATSSGVTGIVSSYPLSTASYEITFNQNVSQCAHTATLSTLAYGANEPGQIALANPGNRNPNAVEVFTYNASGASQYRSFSIAVFC
jgi:hypothetical protein